MNCEEVTGILDDQRIDALDPEQRRQAETHVATCAECARAWHLQSSLAALSDMELPADFPARCRVLVAAGVQPAAGRRRDRRVLVGTLVAVAAAAAVLVMLLRPQAPDAPERAVQVTEAKVEAPAPVVPVPVAVPEEVPAEPVPVVAVEEPVAPQFTARVVPYEVPTEAQMNATAVSEAERSLGQALTRAFTSDPVRPQTLQSLYSALLAQLRGVPGLALVESDPKEVLPSSRHYVLKITPSTMMGPGGQMVPIDSRYVSTALGVEQLQPGGKSIRRSIAGYRIDLQAACSGAPRAADTPCYDVPGVAAAMVLALRRDVFPPDPSVTRPLQAKFRDAALDPAERVKTLAELLKQQAKIGDTSLLRDPAVVRAAIELAANADPALRAQIWRSLRGVGNADLIAPLIASLAQDPDDVRLAAIETLAADFSGNPRVRSALQASAVGDARPLVRAVAERALSGEEGWRQYVVNSLKDQNRPAAQRVEALVYYLYPPGPAAGSSASNPDYVRIMEELLDDSAVRALADALPKAGKLAGGIGNIFIGNFSSRFAKNPAVTDMLLNYLEHDANPGNRRLVVQPLLVVVGSEQRVRDALIKARDSDPDPGVRDWIRQVMGDRLR